MKIWTAVFLLAIGFTLGGTEVEPIWMTAIICIAKVILIVGGFVALERICRQEDGK